MRFAEIVFRSLARRISSMMAAYDALTSGARLSISKSVQSRRVQEVKRALTRHGRGCVILRGRNGESGDLVG
jgi:hypothetical protein